MFILLMGIFWITIIGSNYPSQLLSKILFDFEDNLYNFLHLIKSPTILTDMIVYGIYHTVSWVVAVMLPPMAIFFPIFSLLEDFGYLPRIAFNMDKCFQKCNSCGKQALTICMEFGCSAVGVTGAIIIDSKRERLIAILTNCLVPCNGKFPTMIALITLFFTGLKTTPLNIFSQSFFLTLIIVFSIILTFIISKLLSIIILKGEQSSFILELPPYRKPQIIKVIINSIFSKILLVLFRAITVAAPAGIILWILANTKIGENNLFICLSNFITPFATLIGMDGEILLAFILGFPANEVIFPILIMIYQSSSHLSQIDRLNTIRDLLIDNNWTMKTAVIVLIFFLVHFQCSTTCLTIKKETNSIKWTVIGFLIPTIVGIFLCFILNTVWQLF
ncbi:MAG: nucleoside recognition domain-containing protein [Bacilli bacterium]